MAVWDEYELIEFFGVLPEEDADKTYLSFNVERDGLRLSASFFTYAPAVYVDIFRDGVNEPVFHTRIENPSGVRCLKQANGWECLEVSSPRPNVSLAEGRPAPAGARIRVHPHISVEMF